MSALRPETVAGAGHNGGPAMDILEFGAPMPAAMGRCADLYHDVRELRLLMEKEVEKVQKRETEIREHIVANLSKGSDTGAAGLKYRAQIVSKDVPKVSEERGGWPALFAFIAKYNRFDLLQKRLGDKAVKEMWEAGQLPPGTEIMKVPDVSITKI